MSRRILLSILLCGGLYLLGNHNVSLWDRDEPRYAQASRQMLQTGDWVVPQLLDAPRINKPPLIYWCQAAAMRIFGDNAFAARFPSSVAMTLVLLLLALVLRGLVSEEQRFWTVVVFGTSGLVIMAAKMCLTDAVLLLFITISQWALYAMYRGRFDWRVIIAFAVATGLGLLTKGPVVLGINGMTLLMLALMRLMDRRRPDIDPHMTVDWKLAIIKALAALAIIAAIVAPWIVAMIHRLPTDQLGGTLYKELWQRMTQPMEQHKGPPGYYLAFYIASFFPWVLLMPVALKLAWQSRREPLTRFALAALVGPWLLFECIATKLPHYILPTMPFLAILTAQTLVRGIHREHSEWNKPPWRIAAGAWALLLVAMGLGPWAAAMPKFAFDRLPYFAMILVSVAAIAFAALILYQFLRSQLAQAAYAMAAAMLLLMTLLFTLYLPNARFLHLSEELGGYLQSIGANQLGQIYMIDYKEDSLPFYQGGTIRPQRENAYLSKEPPENWPRFLTITKELWDAAPESAKTRFEVLKTFHGLAYAAKGRVVDVLVLKKIESPAPQPRSGEKK